MEGNGYFVKDNWKLGDFLRSHCFAIFHIHWNLQNRSLSNIRGLYIYMGDGVCVSTTCAICGETA